MNAPTVKHQIIRGADGTPEYVVVPYNEYLELAQTADPILDATIPLAVSEANILHGKSMLRAWREYKNVTQEEMARRLGVSQSAVVKMEQPGKRTRKSTLDAWARALDIDVEQLMG